ncbi:SpoIIE family protein phosphatase [Aldersonia kunmingensis]|uniref:SpoIIE family protein phosphatase n=1 Tax=Aldersonia kunmingensis TaxID=408066 RepID=UPI00082EC7E7|nr:SpoIIE family protein phosphatase [Aldersonia kunmingensis]
MLGLEGAEHRIVAATGAYREYAGRQDLIGMVVRDAFPELLGQHVWPIYDRVYASGQPEFLREFRAQIDRPDSGEHVELFVNFNVHPRRGPDGRIVGVTVDVTDVTEQVRERQAAGRRAAEADRRYERARDLIAAMQRELLSTGVPVLPRVQIAATYLLADADTAAGGDWFDAIPLPDGRIALVVGDVVGHGVAASATMGQLRIILHEQLATKPDIGAGLSALDAAAARIRGALAATVCVVMLDPGVAVWAPLGTPAETIMTLVRLDHGTSAFDDAVGADTVD